MPRKVVQALLAVTTFVVVWLVASPASAYTAAPVCDPRGAITFAPPPQIQDTETSLDIPADCVEISPLETKNFTRGRGTPLEISSSQEPLATGRADALLSLVFVERMPVRFVTELRPPPGARSTVERPPRN